MGRAGIATLDTQSEILLFEKFRMGIEQAWYTGVNQVTLIGQISIQDSSSHFPSDIIASYDLPSFRLSLIALLKALMFIVICKPSAPRSRFHVSVNSAINASGESTGVMPR